MVTERVERNSAIELLRMLAGMAVVVLHFNFGTVGAAESTTGITQWILLMLEAVCVCAVNVFLLISGYCNVFSKKINTGRLLQLLLQTCFFGLIFKIVSSFISSSWSLKGILGAMLPVNYYVILYVSLMLIAPFINIAINKMSRKSIKMFIVIAILLFSVYPTAVDMLEAISERRYIGLSSIGLTGSCAGYTIINFMLIYILGACIRKMDLLDTIRKSILSLLFLIAAIGIYILHIVLPDTAYMYCNPLVIAESVAVFMLFARQNIKSKIINMIAPASFTCYLIHAQILNYSMKKITIVDVSMVEVICMLFMMILGIYMISIIVMNIWNLFVKAILLNHINHILYIE